MTEITKNKEMQEAGSKPRYSVNPTAFLFALIGAPIVVTVCSFWTVIGLFALPVGAIPYLVIGTPILLWAVGRIKPAFGAYALLGIYGNLFMAACFVFIAVPMVGVTETVQIISIYVAFGMIFAPLYAGTFGWLYAAFHPNIRILQV